MVIDYRDLEYTDNVMLMLDIHYIHEKHRNNLNVKQSVFVKTFLQKMVDRPTIRKYEQRFLNKNLHEKPLTKINGFSIFNEKMEKTKNDRIRKNSW